MVLYRRNLIAGGTFFFTVALHDRQACTLVQHVDLLRAAYADVKAKHPFRTDAMVVMPDHLHAIWRLPAGDDDFSGRWRAIKAGFVRALAAKGISTERNGKGEAGVWQRRFWEHTVRNEADFAAHCDYIHYNPVKHGHAIQPADWPYSTVHRFIAEGIYPPDWARTKIPEEMPEPSQIGEPE
jgi:putative transposase